MRAITLFILALVWTAASAQVYTWRDASGKTHYSDTPPPGVDAKKMRPGTQSGATSSGGTPVRSIAEQDMEFRKRQTEAEKARAKADQEKGDAEDGKRNCEDARKQLNALASGEICLVVGWSGDIKQAQRRAAEASKEAGGSMATRETSCSRWFWNMSRNTPTPS